MTKFYDALETRNTQEREAALLAALPGQVAHAQRLAPGAMSRPAPSWIWLRQSTGGVPRGQERRGIGGA